MQNPYQDQGLASQFANLLGWLVVIATLATMLAGCEVVEFIFKAGLFVGILLVVAIIGIIMFFKRRMR